MSLLLSQARDSRRIVSTFRPQSLTTKDYLDLSNLSNPSIRVPQEVDTLGHSALDLLNRDYVALDYGYAKGKRVRFPDDTRGFLYYFLPPSAPPLAGQIRFRVTSSPHPASFSSGHDLKDPVTTLPIAWPLRRIVTATYLRRFANLLLHDGLITSKILADITELVSIQDTHRHWVYVASLYAFGQPFYLNLQSFYCSFDILAVVDGME